jgi:putative transposase
MSYQAPIPRPVPLSSHVSVTMRLASSSYDLLIRHVRLLRDCVGLSQQRWGFGIEAAVVLPSEVQLLCSFPDPEFGARGALRLITNAFARHVPGVLQGDHDAIWSDNTEIIEITHSVVALRSRFIENAPVRAGLVKCPEDWPYSSANKKTSQASDMGVAVA